PSRKRSWSMAFTLWYNSKVRHPAAPLRRRPTRPDLERLEERCLLDGAFRSITGFGNNVAHPEWGASVDAQGNHIALLRKAAAAYADGVSAPVVGSPARPSPRTISNTIVAQVG